MGGVAGTAATTGAKHVVKSKASEAFGDEKPRSSGVSDGLADVYNDVTGFFDDRSRAAEEKKREKARDKNRQVSNDIRQKYGIKPSSTTK